MIEPNDRWRLIEGEALAILQTLPNDSFDAIVTDPPYSSGGFSRDDKMRETCTKYVQSGQQRQWPSFGGDSRDQRSYLLWCTLWIEQCMRVLKPGGYFLAFTDWRQLPVMTDAIQAGGVFWRGIVAWDKGRGARAPHKGYFKHQCEYVVWGTKGACTPAEHDGPFDGCIHAPVVVAEKHHMTGKPVPLMCELLRPVLPGALVLDPFAGSGSTGVAALMMGRRFVGIERERAYVDISRRRLAAAAGQRSGEPGQLDLVDACAAH